MVYLGSKHFNWKGDSASDEAKRVRARCMYKIGKCEVCGSKAKDRHHADGNPGNNCEENIMRLCRSCHMKIDGRMDKFRKLKTIVKPPKNCTNCGKLAKPLRKGLCHCCNEYYRRNGINRPDFVGVSNTISSEVFDNIKKLRGEGLSYRSLSAIFGMSHSTIRNAFLKSSKKAPIKRV